MLSLLLRLGELERLGHLGNLFNEGTQVGRLLDRFGVLVEAFQTIYGGGHVEPSVVDALQPDSLLPLQVARLQE